MRRGIKRRLTAMTGVGGWGVCVCVGGVGMGGDGDFLLAVNSWPDLLGRDPDSNEEWIQLNEQFRVRCKISASCCV